MSERYRIDEDGSTIVWEGPGTYVAPHMRMPKSNWAKVPEGMKPKQGVRVREFIEQPEEYNPADTQESALWEPA